jgi:hypothetical protein
MISVAIKDAHRLENQKITYNYGPNDRYTAKIKLEKQPVFEFRTNPKYIYFDWVQDSGLRFASNESFDKWLSDKVTVITKTADDTDWDTGFKNGRKKAQVDFNKGVEIARFQWMECAVQLPDGTTNRAKGEVKITYKEQPVHCRQCATDHIGLCPVRAKQNAERAVAEEERAVLIETLVIGDSNLRHVDQVGTTAKVCASTGAKLGHTANALKFENPDKYKHVVIHSGTNNITVEEVNIGQWKQHLDHELKQLSDHISSLDAKGVSTVIVGVPANELAMSNQQTQTMRDHINQKLKATADLHTHGQFLLVSDDLEDDMEAWTDYRHYSEVMCAKVLEEINRALGDKLLRRGMASTTPRKYTNVHASYRLGCGICTLTTHGEDTCPRPVGTKRPHPASGSTSPPYKK